MKVALVGRDLFEVEPLLSRFDLELDNDSPEVVISHGGDGTLLGAEREYPSIPKVALRSSKVCKKCENHKNEVVLAHLAAGELVETPLLKLQAVKGDQWLTGLNDIIFRNEIPTSAVRFEVDIDGRNHSGGIIADGLVVATSFGSSGYYRSITHSIFQVGIGLAFNNSTEGVDHLVLREESEITVTVERGPGVVYADNGPDFFRLEKGDTFEVRKAAEPARILGIDTLRCTHCERIPNIRRPYDVDRRVKFPAVE